MKRLRPLPFGGDADAARRIGDTAAARYITEQLDLQQAVRSRRAGLMSTLRAMITEQQPSLFGHRRAKATGGHNLLATVGEETSEQALHSRAADAVCALLDEPKVDEIACASELLGVSAILKLCEETFEVEAAGGISGDRHRALGDVFSELLARHCTAEQMHELNRLQRARRDKAQAEEAEAERKANTFAICLEVRDGDAMLSFEQRRTESWSSEACHHRFCCDCMVAYVGGKLDDATWNIRCPEPGCKYCLHAHDVSSILGGDAARIHRYHSLRNADYSANLMAVLADDDDFSKWARSNTQACPNCSVIFEKASGCSTIICKCGTRFCYGCGSEICICVSVKNRGEAQTGQLALSRRVESQLTVPATTYQYHSRVDDGDVEILRTLSAAYPRGSQQSHIAGVVDTAAGHVEERTVRTAEGGRAFTQLWSAFCTLRHRLQD